MFAGVYPPIPTPFVDGKVSVERLEQNLTQWLQTELTGFVVAGSNGESPYLTAEEKAQLVKAVRRLAPGRKVIAGTGAETTEAAVALTSACAEAGADAALVLPPHYFTGNMTPAVLERHYEEVAERSPVPVLLYNMPKNTGINLDTQLVITLSAHPNIVGLKESSGNIVQISEIIAGSADDFEVFAGSGSFLVPAMVMGAVGGMMAVANVLPNECCRLAHLARTNKWEEARALQQAILSMNAAVTARFGVPGLKAAMETAGMFGGEPRPPLRPAPQSVREEVEHIFREFQSQR